jgi:hypothetical protein
MNTNDRHGLVAIALLGLSHGRQRALRDRVHGGDGGFALSVSDAWPDRGAARGCGPMSDAGAAAPLLLSVRCCARKAHARPDSISLIRTSMRGSPALAKISFVQLTLPIDASNRSRADRDRRPNSHPAAQKRAT